MTDGSHDESPALCSPTVLVPAVRVNPAAREADR
jgi:hypothetical protein